MREKTFGEKAMGVSFNPSSNKDVQEIKETFAQLADKLNALRTGYGHLEKGRMLSIAITELQTSQMWSVKGITRED